MGELSSHEYSLPAVLHAMMSTVYDLLKRLTRSSANERDQVLTAFIRHDLLGCNQAGVHRVSH